jgi:hypothetical protein
MARYIRARKPRADWVDDDNPLIPTLTVDDNETIDTGLLWPDGETVWRSPNPIGFGRNEEW